MLDLKSVVWITGASSGIGKQIALEFAKNGQLVLATSRRMILDESFQKEIGNYAENIIPYQLDISSLTDITQFHNSIKDKYSVSALINNAGLTSFSSAEKDSVQEIKNIIETNLLGSIYAIKSVLNGMIANNSGTIINILSVVTQKIFSGSTAYSASKSGLMAYTKALREEVRKNNIRVINISPGATKTPIWPGSALEKYSHRMMSPDDIAKFIYQVYSIKSNMVVEDITIRPIQGDI